MEVAKLFQNAATATNLTVNIKGTVEEPLFQANQIGRLLGIANIRESIKDFDEDEKGVSSTDTLGGQQQTLFLTELGLYRLLGQSRKPVARPFQKWVAKVVREIRLTGKYEVEQRSSKLLEEAQQLQQQVEEVKAELQKKTEELENLQHKTYEEVPKEDRVYICKEAAELGTDKHKIGKALDPKKREAQLTTGSAQGVRVIYERATMNAKIIEDIALATLKRYHYVREHYSCRVEHSIDVLDIATTVVDTLASSYEMISRSDLLNKVMENLMALHEEDADDSQDDIQNTSIMLTGCEPEPEPEREQARDKSKTLDSLFRFTGRREDFVTLARIKEIAAEYKLPKGTIKDRLERLGGRADRSCCVGGVVHGRGFIMVQECDLEASP